MGLLLGYGLEPAPYGDVCLCVITHKSLLCALLDELVPLLDGNSGVLRLDSWALGALGESDAGSQAVRDRNAQQKLNYRLMLEQALGGSIRSNKDYINNMIGGLGSDLITAGAYMDGGGIGEEEQVLGGDLSVSQPETPMLRRMSPRDINRLYNNG